MILRDPPECAVDTLMWALCPIRAPAIGILLLTVIMLDSWWQADFGPKRGVWERHFAWWPVDAEPEPGDWWPVDAEPEPGEVARHRLVGVGVPYQGPLDR